MLETQKFMLLHEQAADAYFQEEASDSALFMMLTVQALQRPWYLGSACSSEDARARAPLLWVRKRKEGSGGSGGPGDRAGTGEAGTHCSVEPPASCAPARLLLSEKPPPCGALPGFTVYP